MQPFANLQKRVVRGRLSDWWYTRGHAKKRAEAEEKEKKEQDPRGGLLGLLFPKK